MELQYARTLVRVISETYSNYSIATQLDLLEGLFQLADECIESLRERSDPAEYQHLESSLTLAKYFADAALKNKDLAEGFRLVAECFQAALPPPEEFAWNDK